MMIFHSCIKFPDGRNGALNVVVVVVVVIFPMFFFEIVRTS